MNMDGNSRHQKEGITENMYREKVRPTKEGSNPDSRVVISIVTVPSLHVKFRKIKKTYVL